MPLVHSRMPGPKLDPIDFQGVFQNALALRPRQVRHQGQRLKRPVASLALTEGRFPRLANAEILTLFGVEVVEMDTRRHSVTQGEAAGDGRMHRPARWRCDAPYTSVPLAPASPLAPLLGAMSA